MVSALLRVIVYFLADRIGRIIFGSILLIAGLVWGVMSHTVTYHQTPAGQYEILSLVPNTGPSATSDYYVHEIGTRNYYSVTAYNFTPYLDLDPAYAQKMSNISMVYKDEAQNLDKPAVDGSRVQGTSYQVIKFTATGQDGQEIYTTSEYNLNPNGYYDDHWLLGRIGIILGLILIGISLLTPLVVDILSPTIRGRLNEWRGIDPNAPPAELSPEAKLRALRKMNRSPWGGRTRSAGRSINDMTK